MSDCDPERDGRWMICQTHQSIVGDDETVCDLSRAQRAETQVQAVRELCSTAIRHANEWQTEGGDVAYFSDEAIARAGLAGRILRALDGPDE